MRYLITCILFFTGFVCFAQGGYDRITLSKFDKPNDIAMLDTVKRMLPAGTYGKYISSELEVYNKNSKSNEFAPIKKLLSNLSSNGSDDVSKCFHPRHSINFYKDGKIAKYVLICFECEGLRFSDERWITDVKDENKRTKLMNELKEEFKKKGLIPLSP